jgi:diguanylate cyclase (GGDEF)-like protein
MTGFNMVAQIHHITAVPPPPNGLDQQFSMQKLELTAVLQTTLDLRHLLYLFSEAIRPLIKHEGYHYLDAEFNDSIDSDVQGEFHCETELQLYAESFGTLSMFRNRTFSPEEVRTFKRLATCLLFPLRNISLYRKALKAAHTDPLTQLLNRRALLENLRRECILSRRQDSPLSLILVDLDHFKLVNDSYGHDQGDLLLASVAETLKSSVRTSDLVYRLGGEEFVILLSSTPVSGASLLAERIRIKLESLTDPDLKGLPVTASFGVATHRKDESATQLLKRADRAMYMAKMMGRNRLEIG